MSKVSSVTALDDYRLEVVFADGVRGVVSLKDKLYGPVFEPLKDVPYFNQVRVDEFGAICWPNGADLAPDALHAELVARSRVV